MALDSLLRKKEWRFQTSTGESIKNTQPKEKRKVLRRYGSGGLSVTEGSNMGSCKKKGKAGEMPGKRKDGLDNGQKRWVHNIAWADNGLDEKKWGGLGMWEQEPLYKNGPMEKTEGALSSPETEGNS